ncbi:MAG: AEC family transporter [Acholeplasmataceae bacterium]
MNTFVFAFNAITPIILVIAFGYFLKRIRFFDDYFFSGLNKYIFRIGLPALLFYNIYSIDNFSEIDWLIIGYAVSGIVAIFIIGLFIVPLITKQDLQKGVLLQSLFRSNFAILGIPLAGAIGGPNALSVVALVAAFVIPVMNILGIIALIIYQKDDTGGHIKISTLLIKVIKNPLIMGVYFGLIVLFLRSFIPVENGELVFSIKNQLSFFYQPLIWISQTASPLALIALGGQFEFLGGKAAFKEITIGVILRNVLIPVILLGLALEINSYYPNMSSAYPALIALFASPVAISSVVMAYEMGQDYKFANQLVVWSTILSIATLFFTIVVFRSIGAL